MAVGGCKKKDGDPPSKKPAVEDPRRVGPGLGNVAWDADELFQVASFVDNDNGVPTTPNPVRIFKPMGTNVAYMHNGHMVTVFASDSGLSGGGLLFYDVSDPRAPVMVNRVYELFEDGREEPIDVYPHPDVYDGITGDFREAHSIGFAHVDRRDLALLHTAAGIEIWDLTDGLDPFPVSRLDLPGVNGGDYTQVSWQLSWQGRYAYVAGSDQGVFIVDTTDPANPVLADRGGAANPVPISELGGFRVGPIFALGSQLFLSSMDTSGGYSVLDISEPAHPSLLSALTSGFEKFYSVCFSGDRLIGSVRGAEAEMTVHDVSDPFDIRPVLTGPVIDNQLYCSTQDQFVFQGNEGDLVKVDVAELDDPQLVGTGQIERHDADHGQVTPFGNTIFVGNDHGTGSGFMPHQAAPDTAPPEVVAVLPADGAIHQGANTRIGLAFTDAIDNTSIDPQSIVVHEVDGDPVDGVFAMQGHLVNFAPTAPLTRGATYRVHLPAGGLKDWAGNPFATDFSSTFEVSSLPGGDPGSLQVSIDAGDSVAVGEPLSLTAEVSGDEVELAWRFEDGGDWTPFSTTRSTSHTWTEPTHVNVFVRATDGAQTVVATTPVTVHRPILGDVSASSTVSIDAGTVWVANRDNGTVARVDEGALTKQDEISLGGMPTSVVALSGGAWLTLQWEDTLVHVADNGAVTAIPLDYGAAPCGVVTDGTDLYVSERGTGDVTRRDGVTGAELERTAVAPGICGLALGPGGSLWVSHLRGTATGATVTELGTEPLSVAGDLVLEVDDWTVDAEDRARGVPGFLGAPAISPSGQRAWIPAVQANILRGPYRDGLDLDHESSIRAVLPQLDLSAGTEVPGRLDFNDRAGPMAAVTSPLGDYVFVALMGSNEVSVLDAYSNGVVGAIQTGAAPRDLALSADGTTLYVHAWLDRTLEVYDVTTLDSLAEIPLVDTELVDATVLLGKRIFNDASDARMSTEGYLSCASCHLDGDHDGLTWDFTDRGEGLRNTTDLRGRSGMGHGPVHWTANFDEIQDFENDIRGGFGGTGFLTDAEFNTGTRSDPLGDPKAGLSADLDALAVYVASLDRFPASPFRRANGSLTAAATRGEILFGSLGCDTCHAGLTLTDSGADLHDVGTITAASGQRRGGPLTGFDTPTLHGLWDGAPFLHDGSAATLTEVLVDLNPTDDHGVTSGLSGGERTDLEAYLSSLDGPD